MVAVSVPLVLAVGIFGHVDTGPVGRCGFVVAMMSLYWVSEVIPLPVTGLLPLALFPLLGREFTKKKNAAT